MGRYFGIHTGRTYARAGYLGSPERYALSVRPKEALAEFPEIARLENWRYSFGDHDAF